MSDFAGEEAARAIRSALERCNARAAFGLPGAGNQVLFQALRSSGIRLVVPTHELAAAFMAGAYGRVANLPGILLTIRGPGFAYALAGIAEAWQDSAPLVHIVSAPPEERHLRHRHQALDQAAIVRPIVKAVFGVTEPADLYETVRLAFEAARSGEPGPVVVQLGAKVDTEALGPMPMTLSVKWSLVSLRAYLVLMIALVFYRVLALAGVFGGTR